MIELIPHLIWACVTVYVSARFASMASEFFRTLTLFSRRGSEQVVEAPPLMQVPDDLSALALMEREAWAQEEVMRVIRERYADLKDWNRVRSAMGVAPTP